jgi:putative NIF3 family GTP cyclohydrolase 1 type 2
MTLENNQSLIYNNINRRKFVKQAAAVAGAGILLSLPLAGDAAAFTELNKTYTVQQIIDLFIADVPGGKKATTVDTLKSGSGDMTVTGIVTTMFATIEVIRKTIALGANFIIAHEPTFYNHEDNTYWLKNDDVYEYKAKLLKDHNITVWRNHDYIHTLVPDGVTTGVLAQLGWQQYADKTTPNIITLPATKVGAVVVHLKNKLHIEKVRFIGDANQPCKRILMLPGSAGAQRQIEGVGKVKPDVLICGEIAEWETAEYVRDARAKGDKISLIVVGHIASEEPGSQFMLEWLKQHVPEVKSTHVPSGNSYTFL